MPAKASLVSGGSPAMSGTLSCSIYLPILNIISIYSLTISYMYVMFFDHIHHPILLSIPFLCPQKTCFFPTHPLPTLMSFCNNPEFNWSCLHVMYEEKRPLVPQPRIAAQSGVDSHAPLPIHAGTSAGLIFVQGITVAVSS